ncbi:Mrp/NBP35 family ATP-binding protein [Ascoidea rubescens DSM 1968]|uniref:Nucleotide binding protein n=1 Tax=Ascoidea rubescens DSM 1968 TaxID=1344418 RepID=A0A1D2VKF2_9ASCO|nr:nucleotide binding protein [Ascoidea rubescens DSM 1968]ODV62081.1 nucleotide binding protein [Ascoidea rubescens DSM 1968]
MIARFYIKEPAIFYLKRFFSRSSIFNHENPLGLPKKSPKIPRMSRGLPVRQHIPHVKKVILISSAKGGVGKSTVSSNIALSLQKLGKNVGLLDADLFGPSVPKLFNLSGEPRISDSGKLLPLTNYGLQTMSMGYLIPSEKSAVVWRGMMVIKALQQLLFEVEWNNIDILVIDMPPGTGDTQLTISQQVKVNGAVIVSTPQDIALIDAIKGITMFNKVNIPILGLVQNMSFYVCPNCNHESHIFGNDGVKREAEKQQLDILGSIPINEKICRQSDLGKPIVISDPDSPSAAFYVEIAQKILQKLEK